MKKLFLKMPVVGSVCFLLLMVAACGANGGPSTGGGTGIAIQTAVATATPATGGGTGIAIQTAVATATPGTGFAATVGTTGMPVNPNNHGDNLTTIHSAADRPVAKFTLTTLNVPPRAKGVVYIQNDSSNPETLVSDTPGGFAPFTIEHNTTTTLLFRRVGTFKAHLKDYPISADTTITIIITMPYPD